MKKPAESSSLDNVYHSVCSPLFLELDPLLYYNRQRLSHVCCHDCTALEIDLNNGFSVGNRINNGSDLDVH
jgi:hypothetical protein